MTNLLLYGAEKFRVDEVTNIHSFGRDRRRISIKQDGGGSKSYPGYWLEGVGSFSGLNTASNYSAGHGTQTVSYDGMIAAEEDSIAAMYERFGVPYEVQHVSTRGGCRPLVYPHYKR